MSSLSLSFYRPIGNMLMIIIVICTGFAASSDASVDSTAHRPIALVLSGGGSRGLAQIGVLKALQNQGIKPDFIAATSVGAIIGSLYAAGYTPDSIQTFVHSIDWNAIFANSAQRSLMLVSQKDASINYLWEFSFDRHLNYVPQNSLSHGQSFFNYLAPALSAAQYQASGSFDSLPIPLRIVTTDIASGQSVVLSGGNLAAAIRASCGVPLAFSPVEYKGKLLMDGGMSENIPVEPVLNEKRPYYIIAVDVTSPLWSKNELNNPIHMVDQIVSIGVNRQKVYERKNANIIISPDLRGRHNTDFSAIDSCIAEGYAGTQNVIEQIKKDLAQPMEPDSPKVSSPSPVLLQPIYWTNQNTNALDSIVRTVSIPGAGIHYDALRQALYSYMKRLQYPFARITSCSTTKSGTVITMDPGIIKAIAFRGNTVTSSRFMLSALPVKPGDTLHDETIAKTIAALYGTDLFKNVNVAFDSAQRLQIIVDEKEFWRARVGLRYDEFHLGEGYIQPAYTNLFGAGILALLHLQYGTRREKYAFELLENHLFTSWIAQKLQFQAYIAKEAIVTSRDSLDPSGATVTSIQEKGLRKVGFMALGGTQLGKFAMLDGGMRFDKFGQVLSGKSVLNDPLSQYGKGIPYYMLRATVDNLDRFPFPNHGLKASLSIGGTNDIIISSPQNFAKVEASASDYITFGRRHTLNVQVQGSWANDSLPDGERVYFGGAIPEEKYKEIGVYNYIPFYGLQPRALPGDVAWTMRGNYRFALQRDLFISCTFDWGYVWTQDPDHLLTSGRITKDLLTIAPVGIGIELAYQSIAGPIRFSWGRLLRNQLPATLNIPTENRFYLSAGHDF